MKQQISPYRFWNGVRDGIPIALGYLSVSFGFGVSAVGKGLRELEAILISMTNLTSAGQLAGVAVIAAGGTLLEMFLTQLVINLRYALMGISLTQKLDDRCKTPWRLLLSFGITDEVYAVANAKPQLVGPSYMSGLILIPYLGWACGTALGAYAGYLMPQRLSDAAGLLIYAMFLAIIIPPMKQERGVLCAVLLSAAISCTLFFLPIFDFLSAGFSIIISALISTVLLAWLCPIKDDDGEVDHGET